jgi:hypothetical protein
VYALSVRDDFPISFELRVLLPELLQRLLSLPALLLREH